MPPIKHPVFQINYIATGVKYLDSQSLNFQSATGSAIIDIVTSTMASTRSFAMLARAYPRPASRLLHALASSRIICPSSANTTVATFSTSSSRSATPAGPPPQGFRLPRKERWYEGKESSLDKAGKYFLMTEMMRGMWVVLEQYFRPPYVSSLSPNPPRYTPPAIAAINLYTHFKVLTPLSLATQSITLSRKVPSRPASVANTPCAVTPRAKSAALHASFAKPSAQPRPSRSRPRNVKTVADVPRGMTST